MSIVTFNIRALITWSRYNNTAKIAQICRVTRYSRIHDFHGLTNECFSSRHYFYRHFQHVLVICISS